MGLNNKQVIGQLGETLVASELARLGYAIGLPTGNAKDFDILAYRSGDKIAVQVKAVSKGSLQLNLGKFLQIDCDTDAPRQIVKGIRQDIDHDILFVVVFVGERLGEDRFYWTTLGKFVQFAANSHLQYLAKHGGCRPGNNPKSLHAAYSERLLSGSGIFADSEAMLAKRPETRP